MRAAAVGTHAALTVHQFVLYNDSGVHRVVNACCHEAFVLCVPAGAYVAVCSP